jgi:peptidoglycan/xylan/chitin deacetylase (PgdA/CDA1 family)
MTAHTKLNPLLAQLIRSLGDSIAFFGSEGRLAIITYHRILERPDPLLESEPDIEKFTWEMETLAACFNVLPLHDAITLLRENRIPPRAVCITFDDGYRSCHDLALPVLTRLGLPATVFVTTDFLDNGNMWNDRILEAVRLLPMGQLDLREVGLGCWQLSDIEDRKKIVAELDSNCKYLSAPGRLKIIEKLEILAGQAKAANQMLSRDMVAALARQGIEIGGHTITHPILTKLSDESARYEIEENKRMLEEIIGKPLRLFAYPNGKVGMDFDQRHVKMVEAAGYFAAFTTAFGAANKNNDFFQFPRSRPWDVTPFWFSVRLLSWLAHLRIHSATAPVINEDTIPDNPNLKKNVLLIAFHFPPQAGSSGIQRTLSFSKHLGEQDWTPSVLSASALAYEQKNSSQLAQLSKSVEVKRAWALDAKRHLGLFGRYPEAIALPDRWVSWWFSAVCLGLSMMRKNKAQVIWTTYPIATAHLIGLSLKKLSGRPWVADFRDPMTQDDYPKRKWQKAAFLWIEQHTVRGCDAAVFTTHSACDTYMRRYPEIAREKFHVIENGYDEDGFNRVMSDATDTPPFRAPGTQPIVLLHSGLLYTEGRDPSAFFSAIATLKQLGKLDAGRLKIVLRAPGDEDYFKGLISQKQIGDIVSIEFAIPYREALSEMSQADGLLVFQGTPFNTQIPAKIYEYFRVRKPIFGLLDPNGETAKVLRNGGFNNIADMTSAEKITEALSLFIEQLASGQAHIASEQLVMASSRKYRAQQLAQVFNQLTLNTKI